MLSLQSPAKLNLFLRVLFKRADGYHELASLFQAVDLCDTLHFSLSDEDSLTCTNPHIPLNASNLILKSASVFRKKTGLNFGIKVHLEKNIPLEAGLGGGSSNAATTLWALNKLHGEPASPAQLLAMATEIGSDVSFFLSQGTAYCTGRGEILTPLKSQASPKSLWIVKPKQGLSSPLVYRHLDLSTLSPRDPQLALESFLKGKAEYFNDLELPAFKLEPQLSNLKDKLIDAGFPIVLMSGSGTSFFCIGDAIPPSLEDTFVCQTKFINREKSQWYKNEKTNTIST